MILSRRLAIVLAFFAFLQFLPRIHSVETVTISEFLASNTSGLKDEDGDYSDWIEIFNGGGASVSMDGWYLTDAPGNLTKWRFPATNIGPNRFLVVFASGKNRAIAGAPLHANFALSASGEYLALVKPDGITIATEFSPQFPPQQPNISYGLGQNLQITPFVSNTSPALVFVPTNSNLASSWTTVAFNDSTWSVGTNGVGYETYVSGFAVKNIRANIGVCDLATADSVLANLSQQAAVFTENRSVINYVNTGGGANFAGDVTFPGFTINVDENNFVTEATGIITIPSSGLWTFGVNSDDGFRCVIGTNVLSYPAPRGPGDTYATFNLAAGDYSVRLVFYECGGGSEVEFFAAAGTYTTFNAAFRLVGNTAGGGLAVKSLPVSGSGSGSIRPLIVTDVQTAMRSRNATAYIRIPFVVSDPAAYSSLTLRMKYDDGFVAYLNGTEIARRNAPATPQWNSAATTSRANTNVLVFEEIDVTSALSQMQTGTNVLAAQGLNFSASDNDFVVVAELVENKVLGLTNHYFATPTPGSFNNTEYFAFVENLKFDPGRGWFANTNFSVTITSATPSVIIRYTLDGSIPSPTTGFTYRGPIAITDTTNLRAIGFRDGFEPTELETHSYIFLDQVQRQSTNVNYVGGSSGNYTLDPNIAQNPSWRDTFQANLLSIPTLSITATRDDMWGPAGVYSNPTAEGVAWERRCSLEYMRPDGEDGFHVNCGLRIQGGVSRTAIPKHGLRVLFKSVYGPSKLKYNLYPDSSVQEFDTLTIHGGFNDHWLWVGAPATLQRDQWCRDAQNAMGGYGPHGTYVHLYLNGLYWGLYDIGEKGDGSYASHYLGGDKEEYDAFNSDELIDGDAAAWNAMFAIANTGITNDVAYNNLAQYLDIPNFVDYMLMNFYAANTDWPWHNWNAARRRVSGAGFHFFSWDAEWTFGIGSGVTGDQTGVNTGSPGILYAALRAHPEFRRQFGDHAQKALFNSGALTPAAAQGRWEQRKNEIERAIVGETARWGGGNTPQTWASAEAQVYSWFPQRTTILLNQLRAAGLYPQLNAPAFTPYGGLLPPGYGLALTNPNPSGVIYFTLDGTDPRVWGGAVSASAQFYSAPVVLNSATAVRARILDGTNWSAQVEANFYVVQDFSALKVTEIMYHPSDFAFYTGDELEFLELKNTGTNTLDLSGLQFTHGITFAFTNGTRLAPGAFLVLARNPTAFAARYPGVTANGIYTGRLDNGGETITLEHLLGATAFSFRYDTRPPWPVTADGLGFSLVPRDPSSNSGDGSNWRASANAGGSPGADDPVPSIPVVLINEILTHTDPPQVDAIELHNPSATAVDIGGWFLSDDLAQPKKFRIPSGRTISGGGFIVFTEADFNPNPGSPTSFALSSHGESLYLFSGDINTNLTGYAHGIEFGAAANGVSFGRYVISTGEEQWPAQNSLTLGASNSGPRIGPVVINEIMYHPASGYDEFIEIYNLSASAVPLYDPAYPTNTWKLNGLGYSFSNNISVGAGGFLLVVPIAPSEFRAKYGIAPGVQIVGPYPGVLQDSGERLRLERPDAPEVDTNGAVTVPYIVVDEVRYNDKLPWPTGADGDGPSLQRRAPGVYGNEPTNWFASGITPGAANFFNHAPNCVLTAPTNGAVFTVPANVTLSVTASDSDGGILRVEFYDGDIKLGEVTSAPFTLVWSNAPVGTHTLVAKARDNGLAVTASASVTITVNPPPIGLGIGLRGDYFDNIDFTGTRVRRIDPTVSFDWGSGQPDPAIGADTFSVRWLGQVQPRFSETYTFYTVSDDGVRLWVNNQLLVDNWTDHGPTENSGFIALQAGYLYDIKMDMYENGGGATAQLYWSSPSVAKEIIPSSQLYPPTSSNLPPVITMTSPATGSVFVATSTINLLADASDPDGVVTKVEFYFSATKLGEDTSSPFSFAWTNVPAGSQILRAIATDDSGIVRTSAPVNITVMAGFTTNVTMIATGSVWKYRDTGEDLGNVWIGIAVKDAGWSNGLAQLGYGDGDERTVLNYGTNVNAKYITSYFRRSFVLQDISNFSSLGLRILRDDGAVVYLNGSEIYRDNMPGGPINYLTTALVAVGGADESTFYPASVNPGYLVPGTNVIAVEIHQSGGTSSDISFDFDLTGVQSFIAPYITTQPQSQTVSEGSSASFSIISSGTPPFLYQWRINNTNLPNETNSVLAFPSAQHPQAGNYFVIISNRAGSITSQVATLTVLLADSDGDGMPDAWELAHGLNPNVNDAALDPDGDGMSNLQEYISGTDPQDAQSVLRVSLVNQGLAGLRLQFNALSNIAYAVQVRPDIATGAWNNISLIPSASTNRVILLQVTPSGISQFYRARTR